MRSTSIYLYGENLFFIPRVTVKGGPIKITRPIVEVARNAPLSEIGAAMHKSLACSRVVELPPSPGVFKDLLVKSKARSNKKLVEKGLMLSAVADQSKLELNLMIGDRSTRAFVSKDQSSIIVENFEEIEVDEIGQLIVSAFEVEQDQA